MSTRSFDTITKASTPLSDFGIDDVLIAFNPRGDMTRFQSKVRKPEAGGTRIKLLFTAPNFLKIFVDFREKML